MVVPTRRHVATIFLAVAAFLFHFRPWTGGLLEDHQFSAVWLLDGPQGLAEMLGAPGLAGRPFHLVPAAVGLLLSNGGYTGMWFVLGLVAGGQVLAATWALRPVVFPLSLRLGIAATVAFHPWWPAGDILRFMPAQVAVLIFIVWVGVLVRFTAVPRLPAGLLLVVLPVAAMLTYQALVAVYPVMILVVSVALQRNRPGIVKAAILSGFGLLIALTYSVFVVPALFPGSYESVLLEAGGGWINAVPAILTTLVREAAPVVIAAAALAIATIGLLWMKSIPLHIGLIVFGILVISPGAALVFSAQPLHLNDPERVAHPIGVMIWAALVLIAASARSRHFSAASVGASLAAISILAATPALFVWQHFANLQGELIRAVESVSIDVEDGTRVVVADYSGIYGDVYTLFPPHLSFALAVESGRFVATEICTPAGVVRDHPYASRFPLVTTPDCSASMSTPVLQVEKELSSGRIQVLVFDD